MEATEGLAALDAFEETEATFNTKLEESLIRSQIVYKVYANHGITETR
jgi:hypothetical protein